MAEWIIFNWRFIRNIIIIKPLAIILNAGFIRWHNHLVNIQMSSYSQLSPTTHQTIDRSLPRFVFVPKIYFIDIGAVSNMRCSGCIRNRKLPLKAAAKRRRKIRGVAGCYKPHWLTTLHPYSILHITSHIGKTMRLAQATNRMIFAGHRDSPNCKTS